MPPPPETRAFLWGPNTSVQDALCKLARSLPDPQAGLPRFAPFPEPSGAHLQVGGEDAEVGGQLREPQVRAVHPEQHPAVGLALTVRGAPPQQRAGPRRTAHGRQLQQDRQGQEHADRGGVHGARAGGLERAAVGGQRPGCRGPRPLSARLQRWAPRSCPTAGAPRISAAGPGRARCRHAGLWSGPGCSRRRGRERSCCRPPARCGAASPLARLFFKALQPELRAQ